MRHFYAILWVPRHIRRGEIYLRQGLDRLLGRRASWTGSVVLDLSRPGSPGFGRYYRVAHSYRDPNTGHWEIRWNASDEVFLPLTEPVYAFDGSTWDLPVAGRVPFPTGTAIVGGGGALAATVLIALAAPGSAVLIPITWVSLIGFVWFTWWQSAEPVRANKVALAATAVLAVHNARMDRVLASQVRTMNEDFLASRADIDAERERLRKKLEDELRPPRGYN